MFKALILSGNLVQDHEFIYPFYRLLEEGYQVDVCLLGGKPVQGILGTRIPPNKDHSVLSVNDVDIKQYDLLLLPGGAKSMEYMRQDKALIALIREAYLDGKVLACICHAAQLLISAKIVEGVKLAGYYSIMDDINNAGAIYTDLPAVVDHNIVSTAHYKHLGDWMKATLLQVKQSATEAVL